MPWSPERSRNGEILTYLVTLAAAQTDLNYFVIAANNDLADIEGETEDLVRLRQEMVDFAHNRGEGHAKKDLTVAVTMQVLIIDI